MDELESKLGALLSNPELMQKITSLAQNMQTAPVSAPDSQPASAPSTQAFPQLDAATLQKLSGLMGKSGVDQNQRGLLQALTPYLSRQRISKLERAMKAAKMANMATSLLGGGQLFSGR